MFLTYGILNAAVPSAKPIKVIFKSPLEVRKKTLALLRKKIEKILANWFLSVIVRICSDIV